MPPFSHAHTSSGGLRTKRVDEQFRSGQFSPVTDREGSHTNKSHKHTHQRVRACCSAKDCRIQQVYTCSTRTRARAHDKAASPTKRQEEPSQTRKAKPTAAYAPGALFLRLTGGRAFFILSRVPIACPASLGETAKKKNKAVRAGCAFSTPFPPPSRPDVVGDWESQPPLTKATGAIFRPDIHITHTTDGRCRPAGWLVTR